MVDPGWLHADLPAAQLNKLFDDVQAEADTLTIHLRRPLQLPEALKELINVLFYDSLARVAYMHHK